jgi:hypothetical protein
MGQQIICPVRIVPGLNTRILTPLNSRERSRERFETRRIRPRSQLAMAMQDGVESSWTYSHPR